MTDRCLLNSHVYKCSQASYNGHTLKDEHNSATHKCSPVHVRFKLSPRKSEYLPLSIFFTEPLLISINKVLFRFPIMNNITTTFVQDGPHLGNQFRDDRFLQSCLKRLLGNENFAALEPDLQRFGWEVATTIKHLGQQAEAEPPRLIQSDSWGTRVDALALSPAWAKLKELAALEGLVAIPYERKYLEHSRIYQIAKLYLFGASSGLVNCPLAMTDGAARVCELFCHKYDTLSVPLAHLTSRDPYLAWTSGQWMTERKGGSDVSSATETIAVPVDNKCDWFELYGNKWFSSAADGEMALALAREPNAFELTLFYVPLQRPSVEKMSGTALLGNRDIQLAPRGINVQCLKDKLGTRQLPTAELQLKGVRALKISKTGRGIATISEMVNITRIHNCVAATSLMRRISALAQDYSQRRVVFGKYLADQPIHKNTLAWMEIRSCVSLILTLDCARLLGLQELTMASVNDTLLLRLLIPTAKAFTAKEAVALTSEGLESIGGQGYIESTGIPTLLRDAQVLPIWEGTTNVMAVDVLRVLKRDTTNVINAFVEAVNCKLFGTKDISTDKAEKNESKVDNELLIEEATSWIENMMKCLVPELQRVNEKESTVDVEANARQLLFSIGKTYGAALLIEQARWSGDRREVLIAYEWSKELVSERTKMQMMQLGSNRSDIISRHVSVPMSPDIRSKY